MARLYNLRMREDYAARRAEGNALRLNPVGRLRSLAYAILGKVPGKRDRLDTATRMAREADFSDRGEAATPPREPQRKSTRPPGEPQPKIGPIAELERILREGNRCVAFLQRPW
jgi:hypothetical protein